MADRVDDILRRYQLALALVDDPDIAGDLFMASRSEAELRRRIDQWRRAQGLPPATGPQTLVPLDADQRQHALHLARRGALQQRLTRWLVGLAILVVLVGGGVLTYTALQPKLDSDPAFAREPQWGSSPWRGLTLQIYQADLQVIPVDGRVNDFTVSIWWEVTGPGASDAYREFVPQLAAEVLPESFRTGEWVDAATTQRFSVRPDRILGLSRFEARGYTLSTEPVFRLMEGRLAEPDFTTPLQLPKP